MEEVWKDITNYEGLYQVSNLGRVKSNYFKIPFILNPQLNKSGYFHVTLCKEKIKTTKRVHKLVAIEFLNHKPNGMTTVVNHINFNKQDNRLCNLELVSVRENSKLENIKTSSKYVGVCLNKRKTGFVSRIYINGKSIYLGTFKDEKKASEAYINKLKEHYENII